MGPSKNLMKRGERTDFRVARHLRKVVCVNNVGHKQISKLKDKILKDNNHMSKKFKEKLKKINYACSNKCLIRD